MNKVADSSVVLTASEDLAFLNDSPPEVVQEFCKIAITFMCREGNPRIFEAAAEKLEVDAASVQHAVEGLVHLFSQTARINLTAEQFAQVLVDIEVAPQHHPTLTATYSDNKAQVRGLLAQFDSSLPSYHHFAWRLDVALASRFLQDMNQPRYLLELTTKTKGVESSAVFQSDYATLKHITDELEGALGELNSAHCGRVLKYIK